MVLEETKTWWFRVCYRSEQGDLDIDYFVDTIDEVHLLIQQGPGIAAIKTMSMERLDEAVPIEQLHRPHEVRRRSKESS